MNEHDPYEGKTRGEYLRRLADDFGLPWIVVATAAQMLGPDEDFDGLITELEDVVSSGEWDGWLA
jgi:hypothetical protein